MTRYLLDTDAVIDFFNGFLPISSLRFLPTSPKSGRQAGVWRYDFARRGKQLPTTDCLIAAIAQEHQAALITGNTDDYPMPELTVIPLPRHGIGGRR
jgi:predicted nucleic acid-binding protein